MIQLVPGESLESITKAIDGAWYKAPSILKDAANATGKYAMEKLQEGVEERYDYDESEIKLKDHIKRKSATYANPRTIIDTHGHMNDIVKFSASPDRLAHGRSRPRVYAAHILRKNGDKPINEGDGRSKAFMVQFKNGHRTLVRRVFGEKYKKQEYISARLKAKLNITKIEPIKSSSATHMVSMSFKLRRDDIGERLLYHTQVYIDKLMKGRNSL